MKEWVKGCDMGFHVGQKVYGINGVGVVHDVVKRFDQSIIVKHLNSPLVTSYYPDGTQHDYSELPSLYPIELTPKFYQPEWQPKEGEWCWFWDSSYPQTIRRFSKILLISNHKYLDSYGDAWDKCAPFDGNMTPPWERGEEK
jgi:hypothetical protein